MEWWGLVEDKYVNGKLTSQHNNNMHSHLNTINSRDKQHGWVCGESFYIQMNNQLSGKLHFSQLV